MCSTHPIAVCADHTKVTTDYQHNKTCQHDVLREAKANTSKHFLGQYHRSVQEAILESSREPAFVSNLEFPIQRMRPVHLQRSTMAKALVEEGNEGSESESGNPSPLMHPGWT